MRQCSKYRLIVLLHYQIIYIILENYAIYSFRIFAKLIMNMKLVNPVVKSRN